MIYMGLVATEPVSSADDVQHTPYGLCRRVFCSKIITLLMIYMGNVATEPVSCADDGVLCALVRLLGDALAVHRQDEVARRQAAPLGHRLGVDLRKM